MSFKHRAILPEAPREYDPVEEDRFRSVVSEAFDRSTDDASSIETIDRKPGSLALRRFQFLLMGAGR